MMELAQLEAALHEAVNVFWGRDLAQWFWVGSSSYLLIVAAEIGDKSQLVCMTLAARHRPWPVIWGAVIAFAFLNTLAVVFGSAIAAWLPEYIVSAVVALLFAIFGFQALMNGAEEEFEEPVEEKSSHGLFFLTFLLIVMAEFGDKTQLAVVALSSTALPAAVWLGATLALVSTSVIGVIAGRMILQRVSLAGLHRLSGLIFLGLAGVAVYNAYSLFQN